MATEQELRLTAVAEGFDQAAGQVGKVTDAEKNLADAVENTAGSVGLGNQQFRDLVGVLRGIDPGVARIIDGFGRAIQLADALGKSNLNLKDTLGQVIGGFKQLSGSMTLLGAGGLVVLSIMAIAKALTAMREESERVTKALKAQQDALNALKGEEREQEQSIENIRDASRAGPFTAEQARAAADTRRRLQQRPELGFLEDEAINRTLATVGGASDSTAGGGAFDINQIARIATLVQQGKLDIGSKGQGQIEKALERFSGHLDAVLEREKLQGGSAAIKARAAEQVLQVGGSDLDFRKALKERFPAGTNFDRILEIVKQLEEPTQQLTKAESLGSSFTGFPVGHDELALARKVIDLKTELAKERVRPNVQNFYQQNMRNYGPDGPSQRRRITNGETDRIREG
jgi:hypothetical protein